MRTKKFLFYLLAALLGGCVPVMSLHCLYTKEDVLFEEKLLGVWIDDSDNSLEFERFVDDPNDSGEFDPPIESEKVYKLIFSDGKGKKGSFFAYLVELENKFFLDVFPTRFPHMPSEEDESKWLYNTFFFMPVHTFLKVESIEPELKMKLTDDEDMKKLLEEDPNVVKHESHDDGGFILMASTEELQAFVVKYADDDRVFSNELVLSRKKPKSSQETGE